VSMEGVGQEELPMKVVVFGATGGTGKELVKQALGVGYDVVVYARDPSKLDTVNRHLTVVKGELSNQALIENAIRGADAALSALGPHRRSRDKPLTQGMQNIIRGMKKTGVRRLIVTSTLSVKDPNDKPDLRTRAMVGLVKTTMNGSYEDIVSVADSIRASDLDWTILRLAILSDRPKTGRIRIGYVGSGDVGTRITRADVAGFMLTQVKNARYIRQCPAISN
jgi:putative NADH-flavin reductase